MDESKRGSSGGSQTGSRRSTAATSDSASGSSMRDPNTLTRASEQRSTTGGSTGSNSEVDEGIIDRVRSRAAAELSTQKDRATDGIGSVAQAVRRSTQELRDQHQETVADYVERAADQLDRFSSRLKNKDVGELMRDAQDLARRQPMMFIGSALVLGFAGARFLKSSSADRHGRSSWTQLGESQTTYRRNTAMSSGSSGRVTSGEPGYRSSPTESAVKPATGRDTTPGAGWETR